MTTTKPRTPYEDTSVPVGRSQTHLRELLKSAGATGIQFGEDFERAAIELRFGWLLEGSGQPVTVRLQVVPLEPELKPTRYGAPQGYRISPEQRDRQAWRGLYWYLKAMLDAASFGLLAFEDVFLSFIESRPNGPTVGEVVINQLSLSGRLEIGERAGEGEVVRVD